MAEGQTEGFLESPCLSETMVRFNKPLSKPESSFFMRRFLFVPLMLWVGTWISPAAWAGKEYQAQPGDQVKAGELIVRLKAGATSSVILSYLPAARVTALSHMGLFHVQASFLGSGVVAALAADGLVDYV